MRKIVLGHDLVASLLLPRSGWLSAFDHHASAVTRPLRLCVGVVVVTNALVNAVVPPVALPQRDPHRLTAGPMGPQRRRTLPVPTVPKPCMNATVYGMATLDCHGRIADHTVQRTLGRTPGARLAIRETDGLLIIHANPHGVFRVSSQGHLRLPAQVQHYCGLITGDRVLLAANPTHDRLVIYPPAALDAMTARHDGSLGGDLA